MARSDRSARRSSNGISRRATRAAPSKANLRRIRDAADALGDPEPPDHVWLQIAGRLRQEGRVHDQPPNVAVARHQYAWLAIAAALVLAVRDVARPAASAVHGLDARQDGAAGQPRRDGWRQSGVEDLRQAERLLQSGVAKLKEGLGSEDQALPGGMAGTLDRNLQHSGSGHRGSSDALQKEPQNVAARNSLFEALQRKISLLQDTITLMNEMRKGNAAGVAQVVEGTNKS